MTLPGTSIKSMMDIIFTATLTAVRSEQALRIYDGAKVISIGQYPGGPEAAGPDLSMPYLPAYRGGALCGYVRSGSKKDHGISDVWPYGNRRKRFGLRLNLIASIYNFEL
jgi:hypothetical protein